MSKFPQYNTRKIAEAIAIRKSFTTTGNLSGGSISNADQAFLWGGWENQHPAWVLRVKEIKVTIPHMQAVYCVRSFGTCIAILYAKPSAPSGYVWEIDAAAATYSSRTSRAVHSFRQAIEADSYRDWRSTQLGTMRDVDLSRVFPVNQVGMAWLEASRLTLTQREALILEPGTKVRRNTREALVSRGLTNYNGDRSECGYQVAMSSINHFGAGAGVQS